MDLKTTTGIAVISACVLAGSAMAQDVFIYPNEGQSEEQQAKDKAECHTWAVGQTGFDPAARPTATAPPPAQEAPKGGVFRGAARGALAGVAIGAIAGDAGKGAAIGAAGGGLVGGMRRNDQRRSEEYAREQWARDQAAQYEQKRAAYDRAKRACLAGRNYTVQ